MLANTVQKAEFWQTAVRDCLNTTGIKYVFVAEKFLVGILLFVFAKENISPFITDVRATTVAVGIMGLMGNKGGALIRMSLYDSAICFVCSHLAAHRENVVGRNADFKNIYERGIFSTNEQHYDCETDGIVVPSQGASRYLGKDICVDEHDIIIWLGDLNYRIDDSISTEEVFKYIEDGNLEILRRKDQLNIERSRRRVFQDFQEGILTFDPTYKYQPGTDLYEKRAEKKLRAPAWCDRILWKVKSSKENVTLQQYRRANLLPSDHKPISAIFDCSLRRIVSSHEQTVFNGLTNILSKTSSKAPPNVEIAGLKINFGLLSYEVSFSFISLFVCLFNKRLFHIESKAISH
jgi:phosphatidylinositol-bisphosphatase